MILEQEFQECDKIQTQGQTQRYTDKTDRHTDTGVYRVAPTTKNKIEVGAGVEAKADQLYMPLYCCLHPIRKS